MPFDVDSETLDALMVAVPLHHNICKRHQICIPRLYLKPHIYAFFITFVQIGLVLVILGTIDVVILSGYREIQAATVIVDLSDNEDVCSCASFITGSHLCSETGHL